MKDYETKKKPKGIKATEKQKERNNLSNEKSNNQKP